MKRYVFCLVIGVTLAVLIKTFGKYVFGFFALDPNSYLNHILSMKEWFAQLLPA